MIEMIEWNEQRLEELVRKMGLKRVPGQGKTPIHLSLYGASPWADPLLTRIMELDADRWAAIGYDEADRVSVTRYLGSLGCRTDGALSAAAHYQRPLTLELVKLLIDSGASDKDALQYAAINQQPLTLELAKLLIDSGAFGKYALRSAARCQQPLTLELAKLLVDAGAFDKEALRTAAGFQHPLTLELAKLLVDAGAHDEWALRTAAECQRPLTLELAKLLIDASCDPTAQSGNGLDALAFLTWGGHPVDPQVTGLFLSAGCRTNLDGCDSISNERRLRFDQILKEHAEWKKRRNRLLAENSQADSAVDWSR